MYSANLIPGGEYSCVQTILQPRGNRFMSDPISAQPPEKNRRLWIFIDQERIGTVYEEQAARFGFFTIAYSATPAKG